MRDDEDRLALIAGSGEQLDHLGCGMKIDIRERLIEQQNFRIVEQRASQRHSLPHALRILSDGTDERGIQSDSANDLRTSRRAADPVKPGEVGEILRPAHLVIKQGRMRHISDLMADIAEFTGAQNRDFTARGLVQSCERTQEGRFASAVIAEDGIEFSAGKFRGNTAQGRKPAKLLDQVRDDNNRLVHKANASSQGEKMKSMASQTWNARTYAENAHFVPALGQAVLELLDAQRGERILDLGCGDGILSEKIAALGAEVVGVDSAPDMVAAAVQKGIRAELMDAGQLSFVAEFDAVFSNAALHWMKEPDAVIAGVRCALKPGGRFVGEMGGHGNVAAISTAMIAVLNQHGVRDASFHSPWYYPTCEAYREKLESAGFEVEKMALIPRPTPLPTGMKGWLQTFANPLMTLLPANEREAALEEIVGLLRPALCDEKGQWMADYVRLRFRALAI